MTKELYSWLPCRPPVYKLFRDKPGSVAHNYTCIFVITRYALNSAVRRKHPGRCWFLVRLRQPGKRSYNMTANNYSVRPMLFMWWMAYVTQKSTQPGGVTHDCLAVGQRPSTPITTINLQITLRQIRVKAKSFLNTISSSSSTCTYIWWFTGKNLPVYNQG